jgi:hypothetical protein
VLTPERQRSIDGQAWRGPAAGGVDLEVDVLGLLIAGAVASPLLRGEGSAGVIVLAGG